MEYQLDMSMMFAMHGLGPRLIGALPARIVIAAGMFCCAPAGWPGTWPG